MFQAALTTHDSDADSDMGTIIITDDRSSCRFSDYEEVSECVGVIMLQVRNTCNFLTAIALQYIHEHL